MVNWKLMLEEEAGGDKITSCTLTEEQSLFDHLNDARVHAPPFIAWGEKYIYFSAAHDGYFWIDKVPRNPWNPCDYTPGHVGSE